MRRLVSMVVAALAAAAPAGAQSLFSASGLGLPADALDARARALGSVGIGLWGGALTPTDPAAAAGLVGATGVLTAQPSWVDFTRSDGSENGSFQGERFPVAGFAYPGPRNTVVTLTFGSHLDQRYRATREVDIELASGTGDATDTFDQDGGVSVVNLGIARRLASSVSAGLTVGRYTGAVTRRFERALGDVNVVGTAGAYRSVGRWSYSGTQATGGVSVDVGTVARVAGSATWSGELRAEAKEGTTATSRSFSLPMHVRLGASALLAPGLLVTAGAERADWSETADDLSGGVTGSTSLTYGVGVEFARARLLGREAPLRLGYRRGELPFDSGAGAPTESVFAGGVGLALNPTGSFVLGGVDLSVERGERRDSSLTESFWRGTVTLRVTGF